MRTAILCLLFASLGPGCKSSKSDGSAKRELVASASAAPAQRAPARFGAPIQGTPATPLARVLQEPAEFEGKTVVVEGQVRRACSRKGCWMELATAADQAAPGCRVTFKDYGFFVPRDSAGSTARVEAAVQVAQLTPAHVEHMEQEGAAFPRKKPDGSAEEVRLVANGVELFR